LTTDQCAHSENCGLVANNASFEKASPGTAHVCLVEIPKFPHPVLQKITGKYAILKSARKNTARFRKEPGRSCFQRFYGAVAQRVGRGFIPGNKSSKINRGFSPRYAFQLNLPFCASAP
jgi:hypothetical protein